MQSTESEFYLSVIDEDIVMSFVKVSPKYQLVIPQRVREVLKIESGQRLQMLVFGDRIELIPEKSILEMKGFLKGIGTRLDREEDRL
jgi:AbrB family looped-hinge helix DNA binding protein